MADRPIAIRVAALRKSFGTHEVLKGVSLTAREGDVVAIIGGSGSGKSTMLRCINFLETPSAGTIEIGGEPVAMRGDGTPSDRRQIERLRQSLGMVFQSFNLWTVISFLVIYVEFFLVEKTYDSVKVKARLRLSLIRCAGFVT